MRQLFASAFEIKAECQDFPAVNAPEALKRALFTFDLDSINSQKKSHLSQPQLAQSCELRRIPFSRIQHGFSENPNNVARG